MNAPLRHDEVKPLPHNIEVEQALLGAILINNDVLQRVIGSWCECTCRILPDCTTCDRCNTLSQSTTTRPR